MSPWEIVFRSKKLVNNWLPLAERQAAIGVPCEEGGYITEADLDHEIQDQLFEEFLDIDALPLPQSNVPLLPKPNSSTNKGKEQEKHTRDHRDEEAEPQDHENEEGEPQDHEDEDGEPQDPEDEDGEPQDHEDGEPQDFEGNLQLPIQLDEDEDNGSDSGVDKVLAAVRKNSQKARHKMVDKYSKSHKIEVFSKGDIVTVKLPRGTRTSTDNKRLYARALDDPKPHRYLI